MPTIATPLVYKKTFQYRLKLEPWQLEKIEQASGAVRFVYNWGTDLVRKAAEKREPIPNYYVLARNLTHLKREADKTWLAQTYNASLQNGLKDLDLSVKAFFREIKKKKRAGLPGFRKKGLNESIRYSGGIKHKDNKFYIPKIGFVDYINSRPLEGKIKQATLCKIIDKWFINVVCDVPIYYVSHANDHGADVNVNVHANSVNRACYLTLGGGFLDKVLTLDVSLASKNTNKKKVARYSKKLNPTEKEVATEKLNENQVEGMAKQVRNSLRALCKEYNDVFMSIDDNVSQHQDQPAFIISSARNMLSNVPRKSLIKQANRLLVRRQKKLSRSERNSKNREKARITLEKQHLKIRRRRHDFLHKLSRKIVQEYDCITIKKYDLSKIIKSAYTPLAKVVRDKSWDRFIKYVQYKAAWYGKKFVLTQVGIDGRGAHG